MVSGSDRLLGFPAASSDDSVQLPQQCGGEHRVGLTGGQFVVLAAGQVRESGRVNTSENETSGDAAGRARIGDSHRRSPGLAQAALAAFGCSHSALRPYDQFSRTPVDITGRSPGRSPCWRVGAVLLVLAVRDSGSHNHDVVAIDQAVQDRSSPLSGKTRIRGGMPDSGSGRSILLRAARRARRALCGARSVL